MTQNTGTAIATDPGRIVWGHPLKLVQKRDMNVNPPKPLFKDDGSPIMQIAFGIAYPKAYFMAVIWPAMCAEAAKGFPQGVPQNFSWKIDDGDGMDSANKPFAEREGYAGCYVLTVSSSTGYAPALYRFNPQSGGYDQLTENDVKCGDFVAPSLNFVVNVPQIRTHTPSLYVNPTAIEFVGHGKAIVATGVNPMQVFGGRQHALPPGASSTPVSSAPAGVGMPQPGQPAMPGAPAGYPAQQPMPAGYPAPTPQMQPAPAGYPAPVPQAQPYAPQPALPAPAYDFTQGGQPAMQPAPAGYPAPVPQAQPYAPQPAPAGYPAQQPMPQPGQPPMMPGQMPPR